MTGIRTALSLEEGLDLQAERHKKANPVESD
jgi:hypothetical protein